MVLRCPRFPRTTAPLSCWRRSAGVHYPNILCVAEKPSEDQFSLRGRRWKGKEKGKGILVAKETQGVRKEGTGGKHVLKADQSGF